MIPNQTKKTQKDSLHAIGSFFYPFTKQYKANILLFVITLASVALPHLFRALLGKPSLVTSISFQTIADAQVLKTTSFFEFVLSSTGNVYLVLLFPFLESPALLLGLQMVLLVISVFLMRRIIDYLIVRNFLFLNLRIRRQTLSTVILLLYIFSPMTMFMGMTLTSTLFHLDLVLLFSVLWIKVIEMNTLYSYQEVKDDKTIVERYFSKRKVLDSLENKFFGLTTVKTRYFLLLVNLLTAVAFVIILFVLFLDSLFYGLFLVMLSIAFYAMNYHFYMDAKKPNISSEDSIPLFRYTESIVLLFGGVILVTIILASVLPSPFINAFDAIQGLHQGYYLLLEFGALFGYSLFFLLFVLIGAVSAWRYKKRLISLYLFVILLLGSLWDAPVMLTTLLLPLLTFFAGFGFIILYFHHYEIQILKTVVHLLLFVMIFYSVFSYGVDALSFSPQSDLVSSVESLSLYQEGVVLSHASYGPYLSALSNHTPFYETVDQELYRQVVEEIYYSRDLARTRQLLNHYEISYILITPAMKTSLVWENRNIGLLFLLEKADAFIELERSDGFQIFKYE